MSSILSRSLGDVKNQADTSLARRISDGAGASGSNSRNSPYSRPSEGSWKHDKFHSDGSTSATRPPARAGSNAKSPKLKISNLHYEVSERELELLFKQIGTIAAGPKIKFDRSGRSEGVAWVTFTNTEDASQAREAFDGAMAKGQPITVQYDFYLDRASERGQAAPGSLLARLDQPERTRRTEDRASEGRSGRGGRPTRGVERGVGNSDRGSRGRGGRGGGRGGRPARSAPKTNDNLDKELEAFMSAPAGSTAEKATAPAQTAANGDVEMSG
ncbi:hypothetical protein ACM66B_006104 [Microbotryomycetes sp. NB124-2]